MPINQHEGNENVALVSNLEPILCDSGRNAAASSTVLIVGNPPFTPQSVEAALENAIIPVIRVESEDTIDGLADSPLSEDRPSSRIQRKPSAPRTKLENTTLNNIASIPALVGGAVIRLFREAHRATELNPYTNVTSVIRTVVGRALAKGFRSAAFYSPVGESVNKCVSESLSTEAVAAKIVETPASTITVVKFVKREVEKNSVNKIKMEERFVKLTEAVEEKTMRIENGKPTRWFDTARSRARKRTYLTKKGLTRWNTVRRRFQTNRNLAVSSTVTDMEEAGAIVDTVLVASHIPRRTRAICPCPA